MSLSLFQKNVFTPTRKVTVYKKNSMFGNINKIEMRLIEFGTHKYAQYNDAPFVAGIPKRKRKAIQMTESYKPYMLIVEGWDNIEPNGMFDGGKSTTNGEVTCSQAKYSSFDGGYESDFDEVIDKLIESGEVKVIADYRGYDSYGTMQP